MTDLSPSGIRGLGQKAAAETLRQARMVRTMAIAGVIRPHHPVRLTHAARAIIDQGIGFAGGIGAQAALNPDHTALIDELGSLTWKQIDQRSTRLANALAHLGVSEQDSIAVLCRNHRYFLEVSTAASKLGADILYLNTAFAAPQLAEVCAREEPSFVVHDQEFTELMDNSGISQSRILAFVDDPTEAELPTVETLIATGSTRKLPKAPRLSRPIILTSGTTGTPKGAPRSEAGLDGAVALLSGIAFRANGITHIAAPVFHTWGWAHLNLAMLLNSTMVLHRRFDPETCLELLRKHRCDTLVVIPVMLQRILALPEEKLRGDWSFLKVVAASGSALPGNLCLEWMDTFGDNLFNTYGSTEVAWATMAGPKDLRLAPGTAGRPPYNTVVRLYDEHGKPTPEGESGRIFVGNSMLFGGYTGKEGGHKEMIDGLMSSGDVGRFDNHGLLFVEGRDDEMIVSGGENVFPAEVENALARHSSVHEAAAIGVPDHEFGQRLRAFVVTVDEVSEDDLKAWVKQQLARYKVPREIIFLEELPRNATGKILKRELKEYDHS
ncbi:MAG TPA: AMP-binding protein [Marmoricola sp.]|nr:AMP-binding protein [Marmoricola sp.]